MLLEIAAEEREVAEMILPRQLLGRLALRAQRQLELQDDILVDERLGRVAAHPARDEVEILRRDVQQRGIVGHVARLAEAVLHLHHKPAEQLAHTRTALLVLALARTAVHVVVESDEERLELQQHELVEADAVGLAEIHAEQGEHIVDYLRQHGRLGAAAVGTQV